ncbi:MAG: HisA/HisF-related TIM barrel protein [Actinomycetota bacterium]|nr:HisA/HisF-related TIM barrel protein [Actinomycetota bacterium]
MTFLILPALDVWHGHLALATTEGPRPAEAFDGDPVAAARAAVAAGARALHLVDLDLAYGGIQGLDVAAVRAVAPEAILQVSGGIGDAVTGRAYLDAGADRFVLGSSTLADDTGTLRALRDAGPDVVVGIEVEDGRIRARGAGRADETEGLDLMSTLGWLHAARAPAFLVTSIDRVGGLGGPDVDLVRRVARAGRPTYAAGGVRSLEDLGALRAAGAAGAVVGRATLEGRIDLGEALAWAEA